MPEPVSIHELLHHYPHSPGGSGFFVVLSHFNLPHRASKGVVYTIPR